MSFTDSAVRLAVCSNVADCAKAAAGETVEWYPGPGEYCPDCGEALNAYQPQSVQPQSVQPPEPMAAAAPAAPEPPPAALSSLPNAAPQKPPTQADIGYITPHPRRNRIARFMTPLRWFWIVLGAALATTAVLYMSHREVATGNAAAGVIAVCPSSNVRQLASDLVRGYAQKSATSASRFSVAAVGACDVRFSTGPEPPDAVIARDGIVAIVNPLNTIDRVSETQLRGIFSGAIRDWSQLGGAPAAIVPVLPDASTDEAKALGTSLLYNVTIDRSVRRAGSSADVTRAVTGADRTSRGAIGLVAFSQAISAKVVPLAYLPPPNLLTIGTGRYPYTMRIAIVPGPGHEAGKAAGLIDYARSGDGAAIVLKNGLVPREGL
jgi:hypothetical protein